MKWYQFFLLMSAAYFAPHLGPGISVVTGTVFLVTALIAWRRGE